MIYGAMLAGGVGSRMKSAVIPKQFLEVDGKPIIIYTLQNMLKVDRFDYIYIATHKDYLAYMKEMVQKYTDKPEKVRIIERSRRYMRWWRLQTWDRPMCRRAYGARRLPMKAPF